MSCCILDCQIEIESMCKCDSDVLYFCGLHASEHRQKTDHLPNFISKEQVRSIKLSNLKSLIEACTIKMSRDTEKIISVLKNTCNQAIKNLKKTNSNLNFISEFKPAEFQEKRITFLTCEARLISQDRILYKCKKCSHELENQYFFKDCKDVCKNCQIRFMRLGYISSCFYCDSKFTPQEINELRKIKAKCEKCGSEYISLQDFPSLMCNHNICFKCVKSNLDDEGILNCVQDCRRKIPDKESFLREKCWKCSKYSLKSEDFFMHKTCCCHYCLDCMSSFGGNKCQKCGTAYSGFLEYFINQNIQKFRECPGCKVKKNVEVLLWLQNCTHYICNECMRSKAKAAYDSSDYAKIFNCFDPACNTEISGEQLEQFFSIHKMNLLQSTKENDLWDKVSLSRII